MPYELTRRGFVSGCFGVATVGGVSIAMSQRPVQKPILDAMSLWNDKIQSGLFSRSLMAQSYTQADITSPFPFNAFYPEAFSPRITLEKWRLRVDGLVQTVRDLTHSDLRNYQAESQITRLICIEGWSAVGEWSGVPLSALLKSVGADLSAKYVRFQCADEFHSSIDMESALHPQTILALDFLDRPLPEPFGAPCRLRIPTKLGFKNAKFITTITITNDFPGGYWEDQGYNWFAGL